MQQPPFYQRLKDFVIAYKKQLLVIAIVALLVFIASQFGVIRVTVKNPSNTGEVTVQLLNQGSLDTAEMKVASSGWKIVRSGQYEVVSEQDTRSSFSVTGVRRFFLSTTVEQTLRSEDQAEFIGYNPDACVHYNGTMAVSWGCVSGAAALAYHQPAVGRQATYNNPNPAKFAGTVEGVFTSNGKTYMLIRDRSGAEESEGDDPPKQLFYELDANYQPVRSARAQGLDDLESYQVKTLDNGFLVYNTDRTEFFTFANVDAKPEKVDIKNPDDKVFQPGTVQTSGNKVYVLYTNYVPDIGNEKPKDIKNRIIVSDGKQTTTLSYDGDVVDDFEACQGNICLLQSQTLGVYAIDGDSLVRQYVVKQVDSISAIGDTLLASKPQGTLDLNVDQRTGYYGVLTGGARPCGIRYAGADNYVVCTQETAKNKRKGMLNISLATESKNNILKQVAELESHKEISAVSVYKNGIIVSPNYGKRSFNKTTQTYTFNPETAAKVSEQVKNIVDAAGIDQSKYTVTIIPAL